MKRETFTDPEMGREELFFMAFLERGGAILTLGTLMGLVMGLIDPTPCISPLIGIRVLVGLGIGAIYGLVNGFMFGSLMAKEAQDEDALWFKKIYIRRRQRRILRQQLEAEWAGVPDGAISRARPQGEPTPTAASLSRADAPEDLPRLGAAVEDTTQDHLRGGLEVYETVSVSA